MFRQESKGSATPSKSPLSLYRTQKISVIDQGINAHKLQQSVNPSLIDLICQYSVMLPELSVPSLLIEGLYDTYGLDWVGLSLLDHDEETIKLLYAANILTPEDMKKETDFLFKLAIYAFKYTYKFYKKDIAGDLHLLLRLTNKHKEIDTINFAPFADVLTPDQIKEIQIPKPDTKQFTAILQTIKKRNDGLLAIYEPLVDAGIIKIPKKGRAVNLINCFVTALDSEDSEVKKIEKVVKPMLTAMQQQDALFQSIYAPLREYKFFTEEKIKDEYSQEVTTVNTYDESTKKFLITKAAGQGYLYIVEMLISAGAAISPCVYEGSQASAIVDAVKSGNLKLVEFLILKGADVNEENDALPYKERNALTAAVDYKHFAILEYLMKLKNLKLDTTVLHIALNQNLHEFINPLAVAFAAKLDNEKDKLAPLPLWLFMDVMAALYALKEIAFEESPYDEYNINNGRLNEYKTYLINRAYSLIFDERKKLPSVLEEKSQDAIRQHFLDIVEQQKKELVTKMQELEDDREKFYVMPEHWSYTSGNSLSSVGQMVFDLSEILHRAIEIANLPIIQSMFKHFSQHEGTYYLLRNMYFSLVDKAVQSGNHWLLNNLIEANKELNLNLPDIYSAALFAAVRHAQIAEVKWLLTKYKDAIPINGKDSQGRTLLDSCIEGYIDVCKKIDCIDLTYQDRGNSEYKKSLFQSRFKKIGIHADNVEETRKILKSKTFNTLQLLLKAGADIKLLHPDYAPVIDSFNLGAPTFFSPKLVSHGVVEEYKSAPAP